VAAALDFMDAHAVSVAFLLSLVAGLGTGLGGLVAIMGRPGRGVFGCLMGATAGVMLTLSFVELVNEAWKLQGFLVTTVGFGAGAVLMLFLDVMLPHIRFAERETGADDTVPRPEFAGGRAAGWHGRRGRHQIHIADRDLFHTGTLLAIGITIHNVPEGIAVGAGYMHLPAFGWFIAAAVLLHNIPEGMATALPLSASGLNRWSAFRVALLSGLAEPVGALMAAWFLQAFSTLIPVSLAFAGGVMVFITLDELLPAAREFGHQHYTAAGIILGAILVLLMSGLFGV
jgi:ZIP family zinc transporter